MIEGLIRDGKVAVRILILGNGEVIANLLMASPLYQPVADLSIHFRPHETASHALGYWHRISCLHQLRDVWRKTDDSWVSGAQLVVVRKQKKQSVVLDRTDSELNQVLGRVANELAHLYGEDLRGHGMIYMKFAERFDALLRDVRAA